LVYSCVQHIYPVDSLPPESGSVSLNNDSKTGFINLLVLN
jgi:hypothetical protein